MKFITITTISILIIISITSYSQKLVVKKEYKTTIINNQLGKCLSEKYQVFSKRDQ